MSKTKIRKRSKLGKYLDSRGTTQKWLYDQVSTKSPEVNEMAISRWCTGESTPAYTQYSVIAQILGVSVDQIK